MQSASSPIRLDEAVAPKQRAAVRAAMPAIGHIPSLNGLRALSFLLVFVSHAGQGRTSPGGFGVTVFFFLSGFLITTLLRAEHAHHGRVNLAYFWLRRSLRILPPFYLVLICATLWTAFAYPSGTLSHAAVLARAYHITNYWTIYHGEMGEPVGTTVYWSLAVEEHFYLLFPWIFVLMQRLRLSQRHQAFAFWGLCGLVLLWRCILVGEFHLSDNYIGRASDTRIDSILFGCALAVWSNPVLDRPNLTPNLWKYLILPAAILALLASMAIPNIMFRDTLRYTVQGVALTFVFIAAIRFHHWMPFRALSWPPLAFIGVLSYSLYLMHHAVIFAVRQVLPGSVLMQAVAAFSISMTLAWVMYVCIERPCAKLRKRLTD